ncbi:MAG TPA: PIN domain-containing protein [archaeon]|nr:PIN domain-containing protein [archaeon]
MARRFYPDTSVWRDYFEDRKDNVRPLGEFAFRFLRKCQENQWIILVSGEVEKELLAYYSQKRVEEIFSNFHDIIRNVEESRRQVSEAISFSRKTKKAFPFSDILHSIIARDNNAILVSRDRHFAEIGIVECVLPEEVD